MDICDASSTDPNWHHNSNPPTTRDLRLNAVNSSFRPTTYEQLRELLSFRPWHTSLREHVVACALRAGYLQALTPAGHKRLDPGGKYHGRFRKANDYHQFDATPPVSLHTRNTHKHTYTHTHTHAQAHTLTHEGAHTEAYTHALGDKHIRTREHRNRHAHTQPHKDRLAHFQLAPTHTSRHVSSPHTNTHKHTITCIPQGEGGGPGSDTESDEESRQRASRGANRQPDNTPAPQPLVSEADP
jgi:hypothetical protein